MFVGMLVRSSLVGFSLDLMVFVCGCIIYFGGFIFRLDFI